MRIIDYIFHDYSFKLGSTKINNDVQNFSSPEHLKRFENKVGITQHYVSEDLSPYGLAIKCLENLKSDLSDLKAILYMSQTDDVMIPSVSSLIQDKVTTNNNVFCLDISQGCSGFIYSYYMSRLLCKSLGGKVLVVHSECYQSKIQDKDTDISVLFSDASFCYVISESNLIHDFDFSFWNQSDSKGSMYCSNDYDHFAKVTYGKIVMKGSDIYNFAIQNVPKEINDILLKNQLSPDDLSLFVPHQANSHLMSAICTKSSIPKHLMLNSLHEYANTVSCSIPLSLLNSNEHFSKGENILFTGFGVGLSIANMLIQIK